jgi:hypothetical protein
MDASDVSMGYPAPLLIVKWRLNCSGRSLNVRNQRDLTGIVPGPVEGANDFIGTGVHR